MSWYAKVFPYIIGFGVGIALSLLTVFQSVKYPALPAMKSEYTRPAVHELRYDTHYLASEDRLRREIENSTAKCQCKTPSQEKYRRQYERRLNESRNQRKENEMRDVPVGFCGYLSPLSSVGHGITVEPLQMTRIVGLAVHRAAFDNNMLDPASVKLTIVCVKELGVILVKNFHHQGNKKGAVTINGNFTNTLLIQIASADVDEAKELLNALMSNLWYKSLSFTIDAWERLEVSVLQFISVVNIHIRRKPLPDLYDTLSGRVADKVTVITKTFERYSALRRLIDSVHLYYPDVTVVVADDSEKPQIVRDPKVRHFTMPFLQGYFAGRNLALSQVTTKYVLYVDDDMFFTNATILELMIKKLEDHHIRIDLVAGQVQGFRQLISMADVSYGDEGVCVTSLPPSTVPVPSHPECTFGEIFYNFFLAKTAVLRGIGFDPASPQNRGHIEFWLDAIGRSQSVFCSDVSIGHAHLDGESAKYEKYRSLRQMNEHMYFRNDLCYYFYKPHRFFG